MLVRCPTCASGYDIALELLPAGQILRCAHCRDAWVFDPPPAAAVAPPRDTPSAGPEIVAAARFSRRAPARAAAPKRDTRGQQRGSRLRLPPGVAASVLAVALLGSGMAAVAAKASLVAAFPPSQAVFATLGLPVNLSGLSLGEIRSTIVTGDGPPDADARGADHKPPRRSHRRPGPAHRGPRQKPARALLLDLARAESPARRGGNGPVPQPALRSAARRAGPRRQFRRSSGRGATRGRTPCGGGDAG